MAWTMLGLVWMTQDDADSRRRMVFGTEDAVRRFAAGVRGWSVFSQPGRGVATDSRAT